MTSKEVMTHTLRTTEVPSWSMRWEESVSQMNTKEDELKVTKLSTPGGLRAQA